MASRKARLVAQSRHLVAHLHALARFTLGGFASRGSPVVRGEDEGAQRMGATSSQAAGDQTARDLLALVGLWFFDGWDGPFGTSFILATALGAGVAVAARALAGWASRRPAVPVTALVVLAALAVALGRMRPRRRCRGAV